MEMNLYQNKLGYFSLLKGLSIDITIEHLYFLILKISLDNFQKAWKLVKRPFGIDATFVIYILNVLYWRHDIVVHLRKLYVDDDFDYLRWLLSRKTDHEYREHMTNKFGSMGSWALNHWHAAPPNVKTVETDRDSLIFALYNFSDSHERIELGNNSMNYVMLIWDDDGHIRSHLTKYNPGELANKVFKAFKWYYKGKLVENSVPDLSVLIGK